MIESQKRRLGIVAKALDRKLQGEDKYGDQLKKLMKPGPFDEQVNITVHVRGHLGEDSTGYRNFGVSSSDMINNAVGFLGCTEDHYRRMSMGIIEHRRAQLEEREVRDVEWTDSNGEVHILTADEILEAVKKSQEIQERAEKDAKSAKFSKLVQKRVPVSGRFEVDYVGAKARIAKDDEMRGIEHLKQSKDDAKQFGTLVPPKPRKPRKAS